MVQAFRIQYNQQEIEALEPKKRGQYIRTTRIAAVKKAKESYQRACDLGHMDSCVSLGDLYATRVLARLGFDWLTLDMEHSVHRVARALIKTFVLKPIKR